MSPLKAYAQQYPEVCAHGISSPPLYLAHETFSKSTAVHPLIVTLNNTLEFGKAAPTLGGQNVGPHLPE